MFVKLGIIACVLVVGVLLFSTEIENLFPTTVAVTDSLKNDFSDISSRAIDSTEQRIDKSIDKLVNKTSTTLENQITDVSDKISSEISEMKDYSKKTIDEGISDFNPLAFFENIISKNSKTESNSL